MRLNQSDKQRLSRFYLTNLRKYGPDSPASVRWINTRNQYTRFETLSKIGGLNNKSILDVGSGLGDLYDYLGRNFRGFRYLGIDAIPKMVIAAKRKYPKAHFEEKEIFAVPKRFDYVFSSGAMTFNVQGGKDFYYEMIKKMYELAKIGVGFNMLRKNYFTPDDNYIVYDPADISEFCKTFSRDHKVIVGYLPGDFTVFLYK